VLDTVAHSVVAQLGFTQPALAMDLAGSITDERQRSMRVTMVMSRWSRDDFPAAAAYYDRMPAGPEKTQVFSNILSAALQRDDGAAAIARWVDQCPGTDRVRTVSSLVNAATSERAQLRPGAAPVFAQLVANTPGLPESVRQRAENAFGPLPQPTP
jgi:hypothetical protein